MGGICVTCRSIDLHYASRYGLPARVDALIEKGADMNIRDREGDTPLMVAKRYKNTQCMDLLIAGGADLRQIGWSIQTAFEFALKTNSRRCLEFLIKAGADVNELIDESTTPLIYAAKFGHYTTLELLIESGAKVNRVIDEDENALDNIDCVKLLLRAGARVNTKTIAFDPYYGRNRNRYLEFLTLFFAAGASFTGPAATTQAFLRTLTEPDISLSNICRNRIRKHLMTLSRVNLFFRIPKLGLPAALQSFLLYNMSVEK